MSPIHFTGFPFFALAMVAFTQAASAAEHPLDALYAGRAHLEVVGTIDFSEMNGGVFEGNTSSLIVRNGAWFAFNRRAAKSPGCSEAYEVVVRQSRDQGRSWSNAASVGGPTPLNPCGIVDGGAFFDSENSRWHYLAQCLMNGRWNVCHYSRDSLSPMGAFRPNPANPVITPGKLFSRIPGVEGFVDEGTPEILFKRNGYYYVTFHGYNGSNGIRGAARTRDFISWEVQGPGLPGAPLFTKSDCQGWKVDWKGGCIGSGHASTLFTPRYLYMLIEATDLNLVCTRGQNWVFGLVRSAGLARTGDWEQYTLNPMVRHVGSTSGCALQYQHLFEDSGTVFILFGYDEPGGRQFPNKLYKIVAGAGPGEIRIQKPVTDPALPLGSYLQSCFPCSIASRTLTCSCRDIEGRSRMTQLDLSACRTGGEIGNANGRLQCEPGVSSF